MLGVKAASPTRIHSSTSSRAFEARPPRQEWLEAALLAGLMALLPFEPRRPVLAVAGYEVTLLEAAAGATLMGLAWSSRRRLAAALRRPPGPLVFVTLLVGAHALSAWRAPLHGDLAFKFAWRMAAMAAFAWVVAAALPTSRHAGLWGLCAGTSLAAMLAVMEGSGLQRLDPFLDLFRESPVNVAGARRATAGSEYPNLAAGFLACGLACAVGLLSERPASLIPGLLLSALLSAGLLCTYSRGGLFAAAAALLLLAAALGRGGRQVSLPILAFTVLLATSGAFAATGEVFRLRLSSEGTRSWYSARYDPVETSFHLEPGELRRTQIRVTNSGLKAWPAAGGFQLSHHWYASGWVRLVDGARAPLPIDLAPGQGVLLTTEIRAPAPPGRYLLVWDMVQEHTTWFSGQGVKPRIVPVAVGMGALPDDSAFGSLPLPEVGWHPSRVELWGLAWAMWRQYPVTGVGSDNFRRLYGPWAGRPFWDTRVYANSLFLETAASTGTLGLLALLATLGTAAFQSARRALRSPPGSRGAIHGAILLALTGEVVAHGLVDYFLAFTGHYLLFGFLVGASAGLAAAEDGS